MFGLGNPFLGLDLAKGPNRIGQLSRKIEA